jgi:hypothetical protein
VAPGNKIAKKTDGFVRRIKAEAALLSGRPVCRRGVIARRCDIEEKAM